MPQGLNGRFEDVQVLCCCTQCLYAYFLLNCLRVYPGHFLVGILKIPVLQLFECLHDENQDYTHSILNFK